MNKIPILGQTTKMLANLVAGIIDKDNDRQLTADLLNDVSRVREGLTDQSILGKRWYASLEAGSPDFSIYSDRLYILEAFACFSIYAKEYIRRLASVKDRLPEITRIYDLGCGIGLSTALIQNYFPTHKVSGTQVDGDQKKIALELAAVYGFDIQPQAEDTSGSMICAFDYSEHFQNPIEHFEPIISKGPNVLVFANSFSSQSPGHFNQYTFNGQAVESKKAGRLFNNWLRESGYVRLEANFYNGRPAVWTKK